MFDAQLHGRHTFDECVALKNYGIIKNEKSRRAKGQRRLMSAGFVRRVRSDEELQTRGGGAWWGLRSGWASTADQVIVVDVNDVFDLISVAERNRPATADRLLEVDGTLIVTAVELGWTDHRVEATFAQTIDDWLDDDANIVS